MYKKKFRLINFEPYENTIINFLDDLSKNIRLEFKDKISKDIFYLIFWLSKKNILKFKKKYKVLKLKNRIGRGKLVHFAAQNIPTNFVYSLAFGLLSGNSNVIIYPDKIIEARKIILTINKLLNFKKYNTLKSSNYFIKSSSFSYSSKIIQNPDARIIWGGDKKVNSIRKYFLTDSRCVDLIFGDRYSISLFDFSKISKNKSSLDKIIKNFYLDNYLFNQNACSSSHIIYWKNDRSNYKELFWKKLAEYSKSVFSLNLSQSVRKYKKINSYLLKHKFRKVKYYNRNLTVIELGKNYEPELLRGESGIFFEKNINSLQQVNLDVTNKLQTLSIIGFNKSMIVNWIKKENLNGIDRIVDVGSCLQMDLVWDGYDVVGTLSRIINA